MNKKHPGNDLSPDHKDADHKVAKDMPEAVFARRLRVLRRVLGISASELNRRCGCIPGMVGRLERGNQRIYASHLYRIGEVTGVGIDYFYMGLGSLVPNTEPEDELEAQNIRTDIEYLLNSLEPAKAGEIGDNAKIIAKILSAELENEPQDEEDEEEE